MKKIAIFGYNRLSYEVISRLDVHLYEIILVETDEKRVHLATQHGFTATALDFRNDQDLRTLGIGKDIAVIFCFFPEDGDNIFLILSARAMDKQLMIIAIIENPEATEKFLAAGANKVINPYEICARKIHEWIKNPDITSILDHTVFGRYDLNMAEVEIIADSPLLHVVISELYLGEKYNLILMDIVDKTGKHLRFTVEEKQYRLQCGDILVVIGPAKEIQTFKKEVHHVR